MTYSSRISSCLPSRRPKPGRYFGIYSLAPAETTPPKSINGLKAEIAETLRQASNTYLQFLDKGNDRRAELIDVDAILVDLEEAMKMAEKGWFRSGIGGQRDTRPDRLRGDAMAMREALELYLKAVKELKQDLDSLSEPENLDQQKHPLEPAKKLNVNIESLKGNLKKHRDSIEAHVRRVKPKHRRHLGKRAVAIATVVVLSVVFSAVAHWVVPLAAACFVGCLVCALLSGAVSEWSLMIARKEKGWEKFESAMKKFNTDIEKLGEHIMIKAAAVVMTQNRISQAQADQNQALADRNHALAGRNQALADRNHALGGQNQALADCIRAMAGQQAELIQVVEELVGKVEAVLPSPSFKALAGDLSSAGNSAEPTVVAFPQSPGTPRVNDGGRKPCQRMLATMAGGPSKMSRDNTIDRMEMLQPQARQRKKALTNSGNPCPTDGYQDMREWSRNLAGGNASASGPASATVAHLGSKRRHSWQPGLNTVAVATAR